MRKSSFLAVLMLAVAQVAGAQVEIVVPDEKIEAQRTYLFQVQGIDNAALARTTLTVKPDGAAAAMGVTGWDGSQYIWFVGSKAGPCCVIVGVGPESPGKPDIAAVVIAVGGEPDPEPEPEPNPDPPPPPPPDEALWGAVIIEETGERTPEFAQTILDESLSSYLTSSGLSLRVADQDVTDERGETPEDLEPYKEAAEGEELPIIFVMGVHGAELFKGPVPSSADKLIALLKQYAKDD